MMRYNAHCQAHIDSEIIYCCVFGMKLGKWTVCFPNSNITEYLYFHGRIFQCHGRLLEASRIFERGMSQLLTPHHPPASRSKWLKHQQKVQHQVSLKGMMCQWWCHSSFKFRYESLFWFEGKANSVTCSWRSVNFVTHGSEGVGNDSMCFFWRIII